MALLGGIIGIALGLPLIAMPMAIELALLLGVTVLLPPIAPLFAAPLAVILIVHAVVVWIVYIIASIAQPVPVSGGGPAPISQLELFCRGFLIGINTSCNFLVLLVIAPFTLLLALVVQTVALIVVVLNFMAVFPVSGNAFYAGALGWFSLAMPMALPGSVLGLVWYLINAFFAFFFPTRFDIDWPTGGFVIDGSISGVLSSLGYNVGSFSFITPRVARGTLVAGTAADVTAEGVLIHETGHALNNAAFGPWFGVANAVDTRLRGALGQTTRNAYGEMLAESHARGSATSGRPWVDCWAPYVGPSGPTGANVAPAGTVVGANTALPTGGPPTVVDVPAGVALPFNVVGVADPDGYLLGALTPPAAAPLAFAWEVTPNPQIVVPNVNAAANTVTTVIGGDSPLLLFRITDGIEGGRTPILFSVVEARPNGPYAGTVNQPVALTAAGSTAGTAGALPSVAGTIPVAPLDVLWAITQQVPGSNPALSDATAEDPTFTADIAGQYQVTLTVTTTVSGVAHNATAVIDITP